MAFLVLLVQVSPYYIVLCLLKYFSLLYKFLKCCHNQRGYFSFYCAISYFLFLSKQSWSLNTAHTIKNPHITSIILHICGSSVFTAPHLQTPQLRVVSHCSIYYWKKSMYQWACLNSCSSRVNCKTISVTTYRENVLKAMTPTLPSGNVLFLQDSEMAHSMPDLPWHRETDQCTPLNLEIKRILVAQDYYVLRKIRKMGRRKNTYQIHNKAWMAPSKPAWHARVHTHTTSTTVSPSLSGPSPEH